MTNTDEGVIESAVDDKTDESREEMFVNIDVVAGWIKLVRVGDDAIDELSEDTEVTPIRKKL